MKLIVGLGNPGTQYVQTRHNVGFEALDVLAEKLGWVARGGFDTFARRRFDGLSVEGRLDTARGEDRLLLLKPTTFMNLSGRSVQQAMAFYKLARPDLLIVVDDLMLPAGRIRLRASGSDAGHNGLKDVRRVLGDDKYARLRIGIDPPPPPVEGRDWVLSRFPPQQRPAVDQALARSAACVLSWAEHGVEKAMSLFNADPDGPKSATEADAGTVPKAGSGGPA